MERSDVLSEEQQRVLRQVKDDYLLLSIANTLQPVNLQLVVNEIGNAEVKESLKQAAVRLAADGRLVKLRDGRLMVSETGRRMFGRGPLLRERDVERMYQLIDRSKEG